MKLIKHDDSCSMYGNHTICYHSRDDASAVLDIFHNVNAANNDGRVLVISAKKKLSLRKLKNDIDMNALIRYRAVREAGKSQALLRKIEFLFQATKSPIFVIEYSFKEYL